MDATLNHMILDSTIILGFIQLVLVKAVYAGLALHVMYVHITYTLNQSPIRYTQEATIPSIQEADAGFRSL